QPLHDPRPPSQRLAVEALEVTARADHLGAVEDEGHIGPPGRKRGDPAVPAAAHVHLAPVLEAVHGLPMPAHRELAERAVLAQEAELPGHHAAAAVGADDQTGAQGLGARAVLAGHPGHDTILEAEAGGAPALAELRARGPGAVVAVIVVSVPANGATGMM